jgi:hypothetical protein
MKVIEQLENFQSFTENTGKKIQSKLSEIQKYIEDFISVGMDIREIPQQLIPFVIFSLQILNNNPHNAEIHRMQIRKIQENLSNLIDRVNEKVELYNIAKSAVETSSSNKSFMSQLSLPSFRSTSADSRPTSRDLVQSVRSMYESPSDDLSDLDLEYYTPQNVRGEGVEGGESNWRLPRSGLGLTQPIRNAAGITAETTEKSHWMPRSGLGLTNPIRRSMGMKSGGTRRKQYKKYHTRKYKKSRIIKRKMSCHRSMRRK